MHALDNVGRDGQWCPLVSCQFSPSGEGHEMVASLFVSSRVQRDGTGRSGGVRVTRCVVFKHLGILPKLDLHFRIVRVRQAGHNLAWTFRGTDTADCTGELVKRLDRMYNEFFDHNDGVPPIRESVNCGAHALLDCSHGSFYVAHVIVLRSHVEMDREETIPERFEL